MITPRFVIGRSQANGLTGFSDGDLFSKDGKLFRLVSGSHGWTLRPTIPPDEDLFGTQRVNYSAPPVEGWIELDGAIAVAMKINEAWAENQ